MFYLIPPTEENLLLYEQWVLSSNQSEIFFGSQVKKCYCVHVHPGNTLFIPSGMRIKEQISVSLYSRVDTCCIDS